MPETQAPPSRAARRRMSQVLPWLLSVLFIAGVLAVAVRGGDEQERAVEPAPSNVMGHIHGLGVDDEEQTAYIGAHFGFFRARAGEAPERVGGTWQDTMAFLRVGAGDFLASGHPDLRSDLPVHLGLVGSTDEGRTWQSLSLGGEADFHALDAAGRWVVGYDSHRQRMLVSDDRKTWTTIDERPMLDVAISPTSTAGESARDPAKLGVLLATTAKGEVLTYMAPAGRPQQLTAAPKLALLDWPAPDLLVGVDPQGEVFLSRTVGRDWLARGSIGGPPGALEVTERGGWYAATEAGVVVSVEQGQTWSVIA